MRRGGLYKFWMNVCSMDPAYANVRPDAGPHVFESNFALVSKHSGNVIMTANLAIGKKKEEEGLRI